MVWLNGTLVPLELARIDPGDRGFLLGDGLFETMRALNGEVRELARHYARLHGGAELLRLNVAISESNMASAIQDVLAANGLLDAALRLTVTRGPGSRGLLPSTTSTPTMLLTAAPLSPPGEPVRLITSTIQRDETSPLSIVKTLNYLPGVLARLEAVERGADDAVLLNHAGRVAEASAATLFVLLRGVWVTPPVSEGALPGIRRAVLLESGQVQEAVVTCNDLKDAEAVSMGSALSLRPVSILDGRSLPSLLTP